MKIGLFGGTFDPIHCGHLDVAHAARQALGLDSVWMIPARVPPHRTLPRASAAHRFAMVALAVEEETHLLVSDVEMECDGPSYTVATLDRLEARGLSGRTLYFITGADAFKDIESWKAYPAILDRCHFIVVSRPGCGVQEMRQAVPALAGRMLDLPCSTPAAPSIFLVDAPTAPVSSTSVRQAIENRGPLEGLVPSRVSTYIDRHGLYPAAETAG
jgi:nicotinate-nucleotide adenylyltransferase